MALQMLFQMDMGTVQLKDLEENFLPQALVQRNGSRKFSVFDFFVAANIQKPERHFRFQALSDFRGRDQDF